MITRGREVNVYKWTYLLTSLHGSASVNRYLHVHNFCTRHSQVIYLNGSTFLAETRITAEY